MAVKDILVPKMAAGGRLEQVNGDSKLFRVMIVAQRLWGSKWIGKIA